MSKKLRVSLVIQIFLIVLTCIIASGCSTNSDYTGVYLLSSGNCSSKYITLKKVQGFGKKYYIVKIYKDDYIRGSGTEFLGVISGNSITVKNGTIIINGPTLTVNSSNKTCLYGRIETTE